MKRIRPLVLLALALSLVLAPVAWAAAQSAATRSMSDRSPGALVSHTLSTVTGVAISPLLGTSALGAYQWIAAKSEAARERLPWYAQPKFWVPALLVVLVCAAKDSTGVVLPPMLKKPLDALEVVENKLSGLVAAGAVVPVATDALWKLLQQQTASPTAALGGGHLAMIPLAVNWTPVLDVLTVPFAIAIFLIVWMASHAINVLILLSPWGGIDAGLKAARTGLLGLLTITSMMSPWLGAVLSIAVIVVAYFVAGWAFRLTVFGAVLSWDFFTGRRGRFTPAPDGNAMFSSSTFAGVPVRTYGKVFRNPAGDALQFTYRPWLVLRPRTVAVPATPANLAVGRGLIFSIVTGTSGTLLLLPPRYRGHEEQLAAACAFGGGVRPAGLRKAWSSLRELIGGREAVAPAGAAATAP
ncbi:MAG TPA: hypothetical protein VHE61_00025 [Opitutaceae bacterium]|nr:hypothetical protein [Opitutaceae bacterium]